MKKQKKQKFLTTVIIIALVALTLVVVYAVYRGEIKEKIEGQQTPKTISNAVEEPKKEEKVEEKEDEKEPEEEYVGEEEKESNEQPVITQSNDEKAIDLAKKEWGEDNTVEFSVEEKKGSKYYVAVKREATVISWYEVDTETWKISEY